MALTPHIITSEASQFVGNAFNSCNMRALLFIYTHGFNRDQRSNKISVVKPVNRVANSLISDIQTRNHSIPLIWKFDFARAMKMKQFFSSRNKLKNERK